MVDSNDSYESALTAAGVTRAMSDAASLEHAYALYRQALATGEIGADHPDFVILLNDLTRLYLKQGAHQQAEPLLQQLLEIKRAKGEDHPEVATVLASLASVRQTLGRYEEAEQLWRRVLVIREATLAPNHFAIATAIEHLGNTCAARGKVHEALGLFQRALTMRELSLGAEHPSLRPARERIADLQLQASEDSFESMTLGAAPVRPPVIPRISIPATPSAPPAPPPAPVVQTPPAKVRRAAPAAQPRVESVLAPAEPIPVAEPEPMVAKVVVPVSTALTVTEPAQPPAVPYMNVLMDIKDEFEDPDAEAAPAAATSTMLASIALAFRERRPAAIAAAVALIVLPLTALGLWIGLGAKRGPAWVTQSSYASTPARDTTVGTALPSAAALGLAEATRDSAATATAPANRSRQAETPRRTAESTDGDIKIPVIARPQSGRLDSVVRAINVPSQTVAESYAVSLQASLAAGNRETMSELQPAIPARRAQLIGRVPVPRYPNGLIQSSIGGEVRVSFDVDTLGRPIMSTFTVIKSPHPSLSTAVKNVVPTMRFEPARTQGPASRTITETVEQSFTFNPRGDDNDGASGL